MLNGIEKNTKPKIKEGITLLVKKFLNWICGKIEVSSIEEFVNLVGDKDSVVSVEAQMGAKGWMAATISVGRIGTLVYSTVASVPINGKKTAIFSEQVASRSGSTGGFADAEKRGKVAIYALLAAEKLAQELKQRLPKTKVQLIDSSNEAPFTEDLINRLHANAKEHGVHL